MRSRFNRREVERAVADLQPLFPLVDLTIRPSARQITRKPLPRTRRVWEREVMGIGRFLRTLPAWRDNYGERWAERMLSYNLLRLGDLLGAEPPARTRRGQTRRELP